MSSRVRWDPEPRPEPGQLRIIGPGCRRGFNSNVEVVEVFWISSLKMKLLQLQLPVFLNLHVNFEVQVSGTSTFKLKLKMKFYGLQRWG